MRIVTQDERFWKTISYIIKITVPLVKVLKVVDSNEKPVMKFLYNHTRRAKEKIAYNVDNDQKRIGDTVPKSPIINLKSPVKFNHLCTYEIVRGWRLGAAADGAITNIKNPSFDCNCKSLSVSISLSMPGAAHGHHLALWP
ncbi:hypothetical protein EJ110_NYTH20254 [Nymphaea thermarum]|nr:hypothetical protein EJ110_NYTH20254 [Nymphaea thermarum]